MEIQRLHHGISVIRDDIYPFLGGGNKGRKMQYIEQDILSKGANAVVTTGGIQSNHCRALAISAAANGWKCTLVLHGSREKFETEAGNARFMRESGAEIVFCEASEISFQMDAAMEKYKKQGLEPYYVWGGGHTMAGGLAYINAISELFEKQLPHPDYIFLASGTGSTQAGILAGLDENDSKAQVIGISVARQSEAAEKVVSGFYSELCAHFHIKNTNRKVTVLDEYLFGGYEKYDANLKSLSRHSLRDFGFLLDTTYSGKAFYGMLDYIEKHQITGNIYFWHTGGILNYLAQP